MNEMGRIRKAYRLEEHKAIVTAISDFERIGYRVSSIGWKDSALEVACYPPDKEDSTERATWLPLGSSQNQGTDH
jgi:hypothetical protein